MRSGTLDSRHLVTSAPGGPAGCEESRAPPARRRRALHPVPEVALGAPRGRVAPPLTLQFRPCRCVRSGRLDSRDRVTSAPEGPRGSSRRVRRLSGGGASCTQYQRSYGFHCASVGLLENPRRGGSGGHSDSEQTHEPRVRRRRALRPAPEAAPGPHCPYRSRRASHLSQRVGRARATSGASAHRAVRALRTLHSRADWPRTGVG